jgi:cytochrome c oxidase subunit 3
MRSPYLAHHFPSIAHQNAAITLGMWSFLITEVMFFAGALVCFACYRGSYHSAFAAASLKLDIQLGAINTAVLIGSSLTAAFAVRAAHLGQRRQIVRMLLATAVLGSVFLGIKAYEYWVKWLHHLIPGPGFRFDDPALGTQAELFYCFYFVLTGLHAFHMVIGLALLALMAWWAHRGDFDHGNSGPVEAFGLYWHFVDLVWIYLFPLLYLAWR